VRRREDILDQGGRRAAYALLQQLSSAALFPDDGRDRHHRAQGGRGNGAARFAALTVELDKPIAMEAKSRFAIREGNKTVGAGIVTRVIA
jgi:hypothetical protein